MTPIEKNHSAFEQYEDILLTETFILCFSQDQKR